MDAEIEIVLHARRIEHRDHRRREHMVRLVRQRRRLRRMVVPRHHQHAPMRAGPGKVPVLQHIQRPIDPRPLPIPERKHPIVLRPRKQPHLLRAPDGSRRQILVQPRLEHDPMLLQMPPRLREHLVEATQRRAPIAGDEAGGVEPRRLVPLPLQDRQPRQRLDAGEHDPALRQPVAVIEADLPELGPQRLLGRGERHRGSPG